jgi:streptomycin 6-kinase
VNGRGIAIPPRLARTLVEVHGEAGRDWLSRLPVLVALCEQRWSLQIGAPLSQLSYNLVAPARREDGTELILKLGVPNRELTTEIHALRLFEGRGAVQLIDADPDLGVLLLEYLRPGTPLVQIGMSRDEEATSIAASVMRRLGRPAPQEHPLRSLADWTAGLAKLRPRFGGTTGPLPAHLVERAEAVLAELLGSMAEPVVLHGDLHHENILAAQRQPWLAIDPKGLVGEPAYEVGPLLLNPLPQLLEAADPPGIQARRVRQLAEELGFDRERIAGWGFVQAVLSAWWSIEDHGYGWEGAIACAEILEALRV